MPLYQKNLIHPYKDKDVFMETQFFYLMLDRNYPNDLKWGRTQRLKERKNNYNCGRYDEPCDFIWWAEVPADADDRLYLARFAEIGTPCLDKRGKIKEVFRDIDRDEAVALAETIVEELYEEADPDFVQKAITLADVEVDDVDWSMVEIDQMSPEIADLIIDRFKQGLYSPA